MFVRTISFAEMQEQRRWKVEFFCADKLGSRCTSYPLVRLRELLDERKESLDPQLHPGHVLNYVGLEHVESITGDLVDSYAPRSCGEVLSRSKVFRQGDLLYGRLRPVLNKVFASDREGICSGEFYVLMPDRKRTTPHFIRALLASRYVQEVVKGMVTGSALPRLQLADLLDIEVPLPPLIKQQEYESLLIEKQRRRKKIRREMNEGPAAMLEALVLALEEGGDVELKEYEERVEEDFTGLKLPGGSTAARGRGRPSQLTMKLSE